MMTKMPCLLRCRALGVESQTLSVAVASITAGIYTAPKVMAFVLFAATASEH
jgi:hypothetical protein